MITAILPDQSSGEMVSAVETTRAEGSFFLAVGYAPIHVIPEGHALTTFDPFMKFPDLFFSSAFFSSKSIHSPLAS